MSICKNAYSCLFNTQTISILSGTQKSSPPRLAEGCFNEFYVWDACQLMTSPPSMQSMLTVLPLAILPAIIALATLLITSFWSSLFIGLAP